MVEPEYPRPEFVRPTYDVETNPGTTATLPPPGPPMPPGYDAGGNRIRGGGERDRLWVHFVWEAVLAAATVLTFVLAVRGGHHEFTTAGGLRRLAMLAAIAGFLAMGLSFSVRAAVPNLAVGAIAVASGVGMGKLIQHAEWGTLPAAAVAIVGAAAVGLVLGLFVALFNVPAWAATLGAGLLISGIASVVLGRRGGEVLSTYSDITQSAWLWFGLFVLTSVLGGALWLIGPVRRALSGSRRNGDPARRPSIGAAFGAILALMVSSLFAGLSGVLSTLDAGVSGFSDGISQTVFALAAVLFGGVSIFGRRAGVFGTVLAVVLLTFAVYWRWPAEGGSVHFFQLTLGVAILGGLVVSRLLEFAGRKR